MEFLRFGSKIPGKYWGCCAGDIIQNFKLDPDTKASIQLVSGDSGTALSHPKGGPAFVGPTFRDIFWSRLRIGTHYNADMPNHVFFASLTQSQINGEIGKKWLAILKEAGFEFLRTSDNSVYTGPTVGDGGTSHPVHWFGLFRNIGNGRIKDPFTPPKAWTDLPVTTPEAWEAMDVFVEDAARTLVVKQGAITQTARSLADGQRDAQRVIWDRIGPAKFLTEAELREAGAPIIMAGIAGKLPTLKSEPDAAPSPWSNGDPAS